MLTGIDVSRYQGNVNWGAVAGAGYDFGICRATIGTSYVDPEFTPNWTRIPSVGMVRGAYHVIRTDSDPAAQARHFVDVCGGFNGSLAVLDIESNSSGDPTAAMARAFGGEFARLTHGHVLLAYTGKWYWVGHLNNPTGADIGPLWHSEYETSAAEIADGPELDNYGGWDHCTLWQYTSSGSVPGVSGNCDVNQFRGGDRAALAAFTGTTTIPQEIDMELRELLDSGEFWNKMLASTEGAAEAAVQARLDKIAKLVFGITGIEAYLEALLAAARKAAGLDIPTAAEIAQAVVAALPVTVGEVDPVALASLVESKLRTVFADAGQQA